MVTMSTRLRVDYLLLERTCRIDKGMPLSRFGWFTDSLPVEYTASDSMPLEALTTNIGNPESV